MKIVKSAGERLLPSWIRAEVRPLLVFTGAGSALWAGSVVLARRGWDELGEHFDRWERLGALAFGGYVAVLGCWHAPHVARFAVPGTLLAWCVAAWWTAPPAAAEPDETADPSAAADAFVEWLLDLIGKQPGIHLRDLYPAMRTLPGQEDRDDAHLRAALRTLGVPVHRSLRLGSVAGRSGVRRADLLALPSLSGGSRGDSGGDAGQDADSPVGESAGEQLESA